MKDMRKLFLIGCGVVILSVVIMVVVVLVNGSNASKELVCTSNNGNITLFYNKTGVVGYTANGYTYDLLSERERADQIGVSKYIEEFSNTFNTNTFGTCTK